MNAVSFSKLGMQGISKKKKKSTANVILNGEKLKVFSLRLGARKGCPLSLFLFILELLANAISQEKGIRGIQIGKEEIKLSLSVDDVAIYVENVKESSKENLLELISSYSKVTGYKIHTHKIYISNELVECTINTIYISTPPMKCHVINLTKYGQDSCKN